MLMATDWEGRGLRSGVVANALAISGLFDLPPLVGTSINAALHLDEAEARRLSPLFLPTSGGRIHAVVGGEEGAEYIRQSNAIATAWDGSWAALPGHNHFTIIGELINPDSHIVRAARTLMS
jgi:arylformamidase